MGGTGCAEGGATGRGRTQALPRPRGLVQPVTGPAVVVPGVHLVFLLKVKPVRAVVSARAFADPRVAWSAGNLRVGSGKVGASERSDRQGGGGPRKRGPGRVAGQAPGEGRGRSRPDPGPWP